MLVKWKIVGKGFRNCQKIRHLQCESFLKQKELTVAFVLFKTRHGAALAAQSQQHDNPLLRITEPTLEARDIMWNNLAIPFRRLTLHKIGAFIAASVLTIFFTIPVTAVQGIVRLRKWFPPVKAVQLICKMYTKWFTRQVDNIDHASTTTFS